MCAKQTICLNIVTVLFPYDSSNTVTVMFCIAEKPGDMFLGIIILQIKICTSPLQYCKNCRLQADFATNEITTVKVMYAPQK
jgi:hypothetical protein